MENTQELMGNTQQVSGCIISLTYQQNSQVLQQITLDTLDDSSITLTSAKISSPESIKPEFEKQEFIKIENLNDFQETFQEAANFEHGVTLTINRENMQIVSLSIFPGRCHRPETQLLAFKWPPNSSPGPGG